MRDLNLFGALRDDLCNGCSGKYVLIREGALYGIYGTWEEATIAGAERFGNVQMLVYPISLYDGVVTDYHGYADDESGFVWPGFRPFPEPQAQTKETPPAVA